VGADVPPPDADGGCDAGGAGGFGACGAGVLAWPAIGAGVCADGVSTASLATTGAPPFPGRDRLIKRHSPPSAGEGPDESEAATRNVPELALHGCHPRGVEPSRGADAALPEASGAGTGASAPAPDGAAELGADDAAAPAVPTGPLAIAAGGAAASSICGAPHRRQVVTGVHVFHWSVVSAAAPVAIRAMTNKARLR
jgi:hypothetical protein